MVFFEADYCNELLVFLFLGHPHESQFNSVSCFFETTLQDAFIVLESITLNYCVQIGLSAVHQHYLCTTTDCVERIKKVRNSANQLLPRHTC